MGHVEEAAHCKEIGETAGILGPNSECSFEMRACGLGFPVVECSLGQCTQRFESAGIRVF